MGNNATPLEGSGEQPDSPEEAPTLEERLEEAERERSQFKEMAHRAQADLANYRRRVEEEREERSRAIAGGFVLKLLPIIDDLQRALESAPDNASGEPWVEGVRLIERSVHSVLNSEGVSQMDDVEGKLFDPREHEAVFSVETENLQEGIVVSVIRRGYTHRGKVLRPAQVSVSTAKSTAHGSRGKGDSSAEKE